MRRHCLPEQKRNKSKVRHGNPLTAAPAAACLAPCAGVAASSPAIHNLCPALSLGHATVSLALDSAPALLRLLVLATSLSSRGPLASLLSPFVLVGAGGVPSAVACFECISVGVGDAILTAFVFLGVAGGVTGPPPARPRPFLFHHTYIDYGGTLFYLVPVCRPGPKIGLDGSTPAPPPPPGPVFACCPPPPLGLGAGGE